ncbi:ABC transporter ATP-binding protein [Roseibium sp.]|uniref:ABC transporter ATP-binding protein n=1 Tax=Roseibium sp. TaxID=1936156 RepID=UPI003A97B76D
MTPIFRLFESWLDPFQPAPDAPMPKGGMAFLLHFVRQAKWPLFLTLVFGGLSAGIEASVYAFIGAIVDMMQTGDRATFFQDHGRVLLGMLFVVLVARAFVAIMNSLLEEQVIVPSFFNLVRWQAHQQVMNQSLAYFHDELSGRLSQKVWQAGQAAGDFMVSLLQVAWYIAVYALTTIFLIADLDWRLGAIVVVWLGVFVVAARHFVPRVRQEAKKVAHAGSGVTGRLVDTYTNIQTVKLFGSGQEENRGALAAFGHFLHQLKRFTRVLTTIRMVMNILNGVMISLVAALALTLWQQSAISTGGVAFTLGLVLRMHFLLNRLFGQLNGLFRNIGTIQDSAETIVKPVAVRDAPDASDLVITKGRIAFEGVQFHYGKAGGVIDHLDLTIEPGERVGLVGPSGAGKTTMTSLLLRFYDPEAGRITIDGTDIASVTQQSLRQNIGMVTQDTSLLHRSVGENIRYGRPTASDEEIRQAARRAHALDFIETLEDRQGQRGFDALVGERGVKLSGGQRQRVAIARVLLKNAPILVLDEATSALDSEVEAAIQANLQELMAGKTVIAIAHRLSTIAQMDQLVVMDKGAIVQQGSHDVLLRDRGGLYAQLWQRQSGGFLSDAEEATASASLAETGSF